ncbi:poly-gamma-glutamate hydrolase family protein [Staphylococcus arlettae]|uniref:poly-gamma-glutamate hydrolase family protein n=1 Tax=Staphylococcus arlettae TaxID=29378 RepID=UPI001E328FC7|nr:poly-gamma-glutamate hydrolase family protein [Staphylococcus arlettae]MCD8837974.1 poly-gamma-glutamate hydrolase family protein [Staphylococcus arlettae]MCD8865853.1 poly-gamma-glutamate hydrolase family protein [Staphylococcus arlettae]
MVDKYTSMTELFQQTSAQEDWEIETINRDSHVLVAAIHGGAIERGTSEIAQLIAQLGGYDYYSFNAIRPNKNHELHVTANHFDDPLLLSMVREKEHALSIHGCMGDKPEIYIGGKDSTYIERIKSKLTAQGVVVKDAPSPIAGKHAYNFVNQSKRQQGIQLELTVAFRKALFKNRQFKEQDRVNKDNWAPFMYQIAQALVEVYQYE